MNSILLASPICRATFHVTTCSSNCPQTEILTGYGLTGTLHSPGLTWTMTSTEHRKSATEGYKKRDVLPDFPEARIILLLHNNRPSLDSSSTDTFFEQHANLGFTKQSSTIGKSPTTLLLHPVSNTVSHTSPRHHRYLFDNPSFIHVIRTHLIMCTYRRMGYQCGHKDPWFVTECAMTQLLKNRPRCPKVYEGRHVTCTTTITGVAALSAVRKIMKELRKMLKLTRMLNSKMTSENFEQLERRGEVLGFFFLALPATMRMTW